MKRSSMAWATKSETLVERNGSTGNTPVVSTQFAQETLIPSKVHQEKTKQSGNIVSDIQLHEPKVCSIDENRSMDDGEAEQHERPSLSEINQFHSQPDSAICNVIDINIASNKVTEHDTVALELEFCNNPVIMLIDTGASGSIIKNSLIKDSNIIEKKGLTMLRGIGNSAIATIGCIKTKIKLNQDLLLEQSLEIVEDDFPLEEDGILGRDFLIRNKADVSYTTKQLIVSGHSINFNSAEKCATMPPLTQETVKRSATEKAVYMCQLDKICRINPRQYANEFSRKLEEKIRNSADKIMEESIVAHGTSPYSNPWLVVPKEPDKKRKHKWKQKIRLK